MKVIDDNKPEPYQSDEPEKQLRKLMLYAGRSRAEVSNPSISAREFIALADAVNEALKSLSDLQDYFEDDCRHDHHGYCQAHMVEEDCSIKRARSILKMAGSEYE